MGRLIHIALYKIFTRTRTYIGFGAIVVIVFLVHISFLWEGEAMHEFVMRELSEAFYMQGNLMNGYLITYITLNFLWVHVPLLVVIVTGDLLAGEAHGGTFRMVLTRPVERTRLVAVKFIAGMIYTFLLILLYALLSLGIGLLLFGRGDLIVILGRVSIIPEGDLMWRFVMAFIYGFLSMATVAALSILFSAMARNSLGPILATMAVIIVFTLITTFQFSIFNPVKPFLLTTYLDSWQLFFSYRVDRAKIIQEAVVLLLHCLIFFAGTIVYFKRKDILT